MEKETMAPQGLPAQTDALAQQGLPTETDTIAREGMPVETDATAQEGPPSWGLPAMWRWPCWPLHSWLVIDTDFSFWPCCWRVEVVSLTMVSSRARVTHGTAQIPLKRWGLAR